MAQKRIRETVRSRRRVIEVVEGEFLIIEDRPDYIDTETREEHRGQVTDDVSAILDEIDKIQEENDETFVDCIELEIGMRILREDAATERQGTEQVLARTAIYAG